ncbi:MAG: glycosyltransferase, partial [Woeseiaceae bacterium]|nr:glycosyltransferase [Woeseiaceae bacterium]
NPARSASISLISTPFLIRSSLRRKVPFLRRKLDLIRNGVDISEIEAERAGLVDASDRSNTRAFKVGYIGQLINRKRLDTLLRAFRDAAVENKELLIIGEGPQREQYEQLAAELDVADQVQFLGFRKDRIRFLLDFDVFAIASELEGIPRCIMEAMAAGIPVVASDIPGCRDIVEHDVNGLLFELGDHEELAEHFERLADTPQLGERLAAAASATVREQYSAQRMAEEYTDLFFEVAQRRQGAEGRVRSSGTSP